MPPAPAAISDVPLSWWLDLHQNAVQQRQTNRGDGRHYVAIPQSRHRLGRPIGDCDPLALEVHPAIQMPGTSSGTALPGYVLRAHDRRLRETADRMFDDGGSRLVTLVGGSSTGKTRACWELVRHVERAQPGRWWLWHPYDPTRPDAALTDLDRVGPDTIVWLNEAQHYLMPTDPRLGERLAAGLRTLLTDPDRAPVLVLATVWPHYWTTLTTRSTTDPDVHGQARDLLTGTAVTITDTFTPTELAALDGPSGDPQLRYAADRAEGGRITQYLAGAPALEGHYRTAPPAARAIIQVAMDARRLGHPLHIPHAILEQAATGYLDDYDWDSLNEDWLEQAIDYTAQPCKGARGPLTRIRARPGDSPLVGAEPCYRLADYLEQIGRHERSEVFPPSSFWNAVATNLTDPELLRRLGREAQTRGRYHRAIELYRKAAGRGNSGALGDLAQLREQAGDQVGAEVLALQAAELGDPDQLRILANVRIHLSGDVAGAEALYRLAASRGNVEALVHLADLREKVEDPTGAEQFYQQAAERSHTYALRRLARLREQAGDPAGAEHLCWQAAELGDTDGLLALGGLRERAGDPAGAKQLYQQAIDLGDIDAMQRLAELLFEAGDSAGVEQMYRQAADRGYDYGLEKLVELREHAGDPAGAEALATQAADRGNIDALVNLAGLREQAGDSVGAEVLAVQAADRGFPRSLAYLAELQEEAGKPVSAEKACRQAIDRGDTYAMVLLARLRQCAGDPTGAEALTARAVDRGYAYYVLVQLAELRELVGDLVGADHIRRFGLTDDGSSAVSLDGLLFDVPIYQLSPE